MQQTEEMKIIVVDDEEDVQSLFRQKFRKEIRSGDVEFHFALSAEAALSYLEEKGEDEISLIISDINMPGMNGLDLLKRVKETFPHVKVFMMTAYSDAQNLQTAKAYQADDYMTKPVDFSELKAKIFSAEQV